MLPSPATFASLLTFELTDSPTRRPLASLLEQMDFLLSSLSAKQQAEVLKSSLPNLFNFSSEDGSLPSFDESFSQATSASALAALARPQRRAQQRAPEVDVGQRSRQVPRLHHAPHAAAFYGRAIGVHV